MQRTLRSICVLFCATFVTILGTNLTPAASAGDVTSKVDVDVWGRAKFDFHYDTAQLVSGIDFATYVTSDPEDFDGVLNFNPRDTRFGFKAKFVEGEMTTGAVMELDFYGSNAGNNLIPRMRLGYAFMEQGGFHLRAGQDWIPIAQQNPGTIDFGILSWGGNLWWRVPQITARYKMESGVELLGSLMKHRVQPGTYDVEEILPWILGRVAYGGFLNGKGMLAVGGGFRSVEVADSISLSPYLAVVEFNLPFTDQVSLNGEVYTGAGFGEEFLHYGFEYNLMHPDDAADEGREIAAMGGFASLAFKASPKVTINVGAGMDDPDEDDMEGMDASSVRYTKNTVVFGNLKMQMTKHMGMGVEVMHFMTEHGEDAEGETIDYDGQRITGSTWFTF